MAKRWEPGSEAEAAEMIRSAAQNGHTISIEGGGTKNSLGQPSTAEIILSTAGLTGITAYRPDEMIISVLAGTPLDQVTDALAEHGQRLAFEPVDHRLMLHSSGKPTIGAVAAINNSGPRRIVVGAARDSLLGVRFVNGKGEAIRSGGRVMKNVTGLDLVKLLAGSWGTLGLLTEVTFKVLPRPETEMTLALRGLDDEQAIRAMAHAMASSAEVSGAAHLPELVASRIMDAGAATMLRIEGFADSVADRVERLTARFSGVAPIEKVEADSSRRLWKSLADAVPYADAPGKPLWRVSIAPSEAPEFVMALRMKFAANVYYDWQGGLVWLQLEDDTDPVEIRTELARHGGGNSMLVRASPEVRAGVPVFQPVEPAIARLNAGIRAAIDPKGIFNPGRIVFERRD